MTENKGSSQPRKGKNGKSKEKRIEMLNERLSRL